MGDHLQKETSKSNHHVHMSSDGSHWSIAAADKQNGDNKKVGGFCHQWDGDTMCNVSHRGGGNDAGSDLWDSGP
jgi:hypothetical protein